MNSDHEPQAIEVAQLEKTYPGGVRALAGISFEVAPGEVFGLLGPNGAGKSTTVGILTTTIAPSAGRARLAGFDVVRQPRLVGHLLTLLRGHTTRTPRSPRM